MKYNRKVTILGAGNVGASIAYTLTLDGLCSEIVLVDINEKKAQGEAMDIRQGLSFCPPVNIYAGTIQDVVNSDIIVVTIGSARKPGQSRIDLAQGNVDIIKSVMPEVAKLAPNAIYLVVSNPVDIITYAIIKCTGLPAKQVIGSGTILDTTRLRTIIAEDIGLNPQNVHAFVLGEHGDSSVIPWSLTGVAGMKMETFCERMTKYSEFKGCTRFDVVEDDVRTSGGKVISLKGATYYAIAMSVMHICENILRDTTSVMTVSSLLTGEYGIEDVCLSLPFIVNGQGIKMSTEPPMTDREVELLRRSADVLKTTIASLTF